MWFNITENLPVQTCLDLNLYIEEEIRKGNKKLLELVRDKLSYPEHREVWASIRQELERTKK